MKKNSLEDLKKSIIFNFPRNHPISCVYLTAHRCDECDNLRNDFCGKEWWNIEENLINRNYDRLSLFTASAYHYYIPAFLIQALDNFESDNLIIEFIIYSLGPPKMNAKDRMFRERKAFFSNEQILCIKKFLTCVIENPDMDDIKISAERAFNFFW